MLSEQARTQVKATLMDFEEANGGLTLFISTNAVITVVELIAHSVIVGCREGAAQNIESFAAMLRDPLGRQEPDLKRSDIVIRCGDVDGFTVPFVRCALLRAWLEDFRKAFEDQAERATLLTLTNAISKTVALRSEAALRELGAVEGAATC